MQRRSALPETGLVAASGAVLDQKRRVADGRVDGVGAEQVQRLVELLVIHAQRQGVPETGVAAQRQRPAGAENVAIADHADAAQRRHIALGVHRVQRQHAPVAAEGQLVGGNEHGGIGRALRGGDPGQAGAVLALPQVVVTQADGAAQALGIGRVAVVQRHGAVQRRAVLDLQLHLHLVLASALAQHLEELAVRIAAQAVELLLHGREMRHRALGQRRHGSLETLRREMTGAADAQAADRPFHHLDLHHAAAHFLLRQVHRHGAVAGLGVGLFERAAHRVHVIETAVRAQERIHHLFDGGLWQQRIAVHPVLPDVEARRRLGGPGQHTNTQQRRAKNTSYRFARQGAVHSKRSETRHRRRHARPRDAGSLAAGRYSNISVLRQAQFAVGGPPPGRMIGWRIRYLWEARPRAESSDGCCGFAAGAPHTRARLPQTPRTG